MRIYSVLLPIVAICTVFEFIHAGEFMDRGFSTEEIFSEPKSCIEILENDPNYLDMKKEDFDKLVHSRCKDKVERSYLGDQTNQQRSDLCSVAHRRNPMNEDFKILDDKVEEAQLYEIDHYSKGKHERVLIKCPTAPVSFVLFENPRKNNNLKMLYVGNRFP